MNFEQNIDWVEENEDEKSEADLLCKGCKSPVIFTGDQKDEPLGNNQWRVRGVLVCDGCGKKEQASYIMTKVKLQSLTDLFGGGK